MSRWARLWRVVIRWWRNEPPPDHYLLQSARRHLAEYERSYAQRIGVMSDHARQAALIAEAQGLKRAPTLECEVRALSQAVDRLTQYLEKKHEAQ